MRFILVLLLVVWAGQVWATCPAVSGVAADDMVLRLKAQGGVRSGMLMADSVEDYVEGVVAYDGTDKKLKICDGDAWIVLGGAGATSLAGLSDVDISGIGESGYVRIGDLQIVWGSAPAITHNSTSANLRYGGGDEVPFPVAFKAGITPVVHITPMYNGDGVVGCTPRLHISPSTHFTPICFATTTGTTGVLRYSAMGVWK